jgi:uncharacterized protein YegL
VKTDWAEGGVFMTNNLSRRILEKLQGSGYKNVDEGQLRTLASQMKKSDFEDEEKLRQLIKTLSALSGTTISQEKEEKIIQMFRDKQVNPNDLQSLKKLLK